MKLSALLTYWKLKNMITETDVISSDKGLDNAMYSIMAVKIASKSGDIAHIIYSSIDRNNITLLHASILHDWSFTGTGDDCRIYKFKVQVVDLEKDFME